MLAGIAWSDVWVCLFAVAVVFLTERYDAWTWRREMRRKGGRSGYKKAVR